MRPRTVVGLLLILGFGTLVVTSFKNQVGGYETFTQATEGGRRAHVVGEWLRDQPMAYDPAADQFSFHMRDEDGIVRRVVYADPKPANFEDAERVVVDGQMEGDVFVAEHILVKCPSKYNEERAPESLTGEAPPAAQS
ncbi:MAG TPA: cytochrome c maturation protein CcmE [Rhodothermales bacterium]|nr:cytochrome c maturation protein CcmE [Rhodothermales bacterium]